MYYTFIFYLIFILMFIYLFILVHSIHQTRGHGPQDIEHGTIV